jgi:2-amino-4-hydroxy-6-hydroxymethyldihydropteridine diphosphokinase
VKINTIYLLLGGNIGNVSNTFIKSKSLINQNIGEIRKCSKLYKSAPWGFTSKDQFLNQVLEVSSTLSYSDILEQSQKIENELGRIRSENVRGFESRIIDIDILYFNSEIINEEKLTIPHYALHKRRFTLLPLSEIAPNFVHPQLLLNSIELLEKCTDNSTVTAYDQ